MGCFTPDQVCNCSIRQATGYRLANALAGFEEALDSALRQFASEHPTEVAYDQVRGTVKWKSDLLFALGSDVVKQSSKEAFRGFAQVVKSSAADDFEVIVVDNASTDATAATVRSQYPAVTVIENPHNHAIIGYNLGFRAAVTPYVLVLDDDSCPKPGVIGMMVNAIADRSDAAAAAGNIVGSSTGESEWGDKADVAFADDWNSLIGCGFIATLDSLNQTRGYNEEFALYYNDTELAIRTIALGHRIVYSRDWIFEHRKAPSNRPSHRKTRMMLRNFSLIVRSHFRGLAAADLILGHGIMMLRQAAAEGCFWSGMSSFMKGLLARTGRPYLAAPAEASIRAFIQEYSMKANLRKLRTGGQGT